MWQRLPGTTLTEKLAIVGTGGACIHHRLAVTVACNLSGSRTTPALWSIPHGEKHGEQNTSNSPTSCSLMFRKVAGPRGCTLCVRGSLHTVVVLSAFEFFSIDFHALSHESLPGKGLCLFLLHFVNLMMHLCCPTFPFSSYLTY